MRYFLAGPFQETLKKLLHESRMWAQKAPSLAVKLKNLELEPLLLKNLLLGIAQPFFCRTSEKSAVVLICCEVDCWA